MRVDVVWITAQDISREFGKEIPDEQSGVLWVMPNPGENRLSMDHQSSR